MAKRLDSIYEPGIQSRNWLKVKFNKRQEFVIGGYKPAGTTFDSILVGYYEGKRFMYAGKVRAGFAPTTRRDVWNQIDGSQVGQVPVRQLAEQHWQEPLG